MNSIIYKEESYKIIGICMDVHNNLGYGFLEVIYKDALEYEFKKANIPYEREKKYNIQYKDIILPHDFYADFVIWDKIILEVKAVSDFVDVFTAQCINYCKVSKCRLTLLINFGTSKLQSERIVL